jgi:hypothetical protein
MSPLTPDITGSHVTLHTHLRPDPLLGRTHLLAIIVCRYTEDGALTIDNNAVERMLTLIALGRKNWLFAGSERGGKTAAVLFTLISSAKRHNLDTWAYLRDVIVRLADLKSGELEELLPDRWKDSHLPPPAS